MYIYVCTHKACVYKRDTRLACVHKRDIPCTRTARVSAPAPRLCDTHCNTHYNTHRNTRCNTHSTVSAPASHGSSQSQTPSLYLSTPHQIDSTEIKTPRTLSPCSFCMCCSVLQCVAVCCSVLPRTFRRVALVCVAVCCIVL